MSVYFIHDPKTDLVKIGFSQTPHLRVTNIRHETKSKVVLLAAYDGTHEQEQAEHKRWAHLRAHGEWFKPSSDLFAYIADLGPPKNTVDPFTKRAAEWARFLEMQEAERSGTPLRDARKLVAKRDGIPLSLLTSLAKGRMHRIAAADFELLRLRAMAARERQVTDLREKIAETRGHLTRFNLGTPEQIREALGLPQESALGRAAKVREALGLDANG